MSATSAKDRSGTARAVKRRVVNAARAQRNEHRTAQATGAVTRARASDASCARLGALVEQLAPDELAVITLVAERLLQGRQRYGELRVATDPRDFAHEAFEEVTDAAVYG